MTCLRRLTAVLAASVAIAMLSATGVVTATGEPPADESSEVGATTETVPEPVAETVPDTTTTTTTTTLPEETGEIGGVEVAVGLPPVPPVAAPTEVGTVDGVEVAVGTPPIPAAVSTGSGRRTGQRVEAPSPERRDSSIATLRIEAVVAATQLIESIQTIDVLLEAWN